MSNSLIIQILLSVLLGIVLAVSNNTVFTSFSWTYWAIVFLAVAMYVNGAVNK